MVNTITTENTSVSLQNDVAFNSQVDSGFYLFNRLNELTEELIDLESLEYILRIVNYSCEATILFGVGCLVNPKEFSGTRYSKGLLIGLVLKLTLSPLVGFLIALLLEVPENDAYAILAISIGPAASYASVLTHYAESHIALSISLTFFSTVLSVGTIPMLFQVFSSTWSESYAMVVTSEDIAIYMAFITPSVALGMGVAVVKPKVAKSLAKIFTATFPLASILNLAVALIFRRHLFYLDRHAWVAVIILPVIGNITGLLVTLPSNVSYNWSLPVSISVGACNANFVTTVILNAFRDNPQVEEEVLKIPQLYLIIAPFVGFLLTVFFRQLNIYIHENPQIFGIQEDE